MGATGVRKGKSQVNKGRSQNHKTLTHKKGDHYITTISYTESGVMDMLSGGHQCQKK